MSKREKMGSVEIVEKYAILMIGSIRKPMPSDLHMQKEMFILTNINPNIKKHFNFQKHYIGPFSPLLRDIIESPVYIDRAFLRDGEKIDLSKTGKIEYVNIFKRHSDKLDFNILHSHIKLIREVYDKLSKDELLFIIYDSYPTYTEFSKISDSIMKNKQRIKVIVESLLRKGIITESRYEEFKKRYSI